MQKIVWCMVVGFGMLSAGAAWGDDPSVTIYNQNFGVVRETIPLDLKQGVNQLSYSGGSAHIEPDSVILRDPMGKRQLQILEQNYRADPVSQLLLLSLNEGKTIDFVTTRGDQQVVVQGRIIRSGYVPHYAAQRQYGPEYMMAQSAYAQGPAGESIIEVDGKLRFGLPGQPLFPALPDDTILKPTLTWVLNSDSAGPLNAELGYVTGGMSWEASYNLIAPKGGDTLDIVGWVTMDNQTGKTFQNAHIKLMAGSVSKLTRAGARNEMAMRLAYGGDMDGRPPAVTEKAFDEYHLYTLQNPSTLRDRETKQVEFIRANGVKAARFYVYDGVLLNKDQYRGYPADQLMQQREYGTQSKTQVWVMREIKNTKESGLGIPLPAGRTRFYQRDDDGHLEFTGENTINHTPRDETVRVYTGDAFDLVGDRKRTQFNISNDQHWVDETFEITLRNRKEEPAEIRVVERLYRGKNWEIRQPSDPFVKMDSQTIEFRVKPNPGEEKKVTYQVHYTW
ncbi:MAG: hypothetical protein HZB26_18740 [Candidatus Hydrogenedentes bacterium]|nr:hypothetical protein [Candidatus Hydrogenedentota bacterium]